MTTASLPQAFQLLRDRILGFTTEDQHSPGDELGTGDTGRLYFAQAPDHPTYPFAVGRLINQQKTVGGARLRADFELMLYDRPRARQLATELLADWIEGALIGYRYTDGGFLMANPPTRDTLPITPSPGDREMVQIRIVSEIIAFPAFLTQYAIPG